MDDTPCCVLKQNIESEPDLDIKEEEIWCPACQRHTKFLKIAMAAKIADVHRRTIYRYIEGGYLQIVKIAGKTTRVCSGCLLTQKSDDREKNQ